MASPLSDAEISHVYLMNAKRQCWGTAKNTLFATQGENTDYSWRRPGAPIYSRAAPGSPPKKKVVGGCSTSYGHREMTARRSLGFFQAGRPQKNVKSQNS